MSGYPDVHTPNLDGLAGEGTAYLNAHAVVAQCNPSRVSTLWGVYPSKTGIYTNEHPWDESPYLVDKPSVLRHLALNGYRVFGAGKVFHSRWPGHNDVPWHEHYASPQALHANVGKTATGELLDLSGITQDLNNIYPQDFGAHGTMEDYADHDVALWAEDRIRNEADGFVVAVGFEKPHPPYIVPQRFFDLYDRDQLLDLSWKANEEMVDLPPSLLQVLGNDLSADVIPYLKDVNKMKDHLHGYLAAISCVDEMIATIVDAWQTRRENTYLILVSDHGQYLGEKMRVAKLFLWDRATRVPLIVAGPDVLQNRQSSPMSLINLYPMMCAMAGMPIPQWVDGSPVMYSLRQHLSETGPARSYYQYPMAPYTEAVIKSLRSRQFRISEWPDGYEFYNYLADPQEQDNLWPECDNWSVFRQHQTWLDAS